jgi:hypothetical protein
MVGNLHDRLPLRKCWYFLFPQSPAVQHSEHDRLCIDTRWYDLISTSSFPPPPSRFHHRRRVIPLPKKPESS